MIQAIDLPWVVSMVPSKMAPAFTGAQGCQRYNLEFGSSKDAGVGIRLDTFCGGRTFVFESRPCVGSLLDTRLAAVLKALFPAGITDPIPGGGGACGGFGGVGGWMGEGAMTFSFCFCFCFKFPPCLIDQGHPGGVAGGPKAYFLHQFPCQWIL